MNKTGGEAATDRTDATNGPAHALRLAGNGLTEMFPARSESSRPVPALRERRPVPISRSPLPVTPSRRDR